MYAIILWSTWEAALEYWAIAAKIVFVIWRQQEFGDRSNFPSKMILTLPVG